MDKNTSRLSVVFDDLDDWEVNHWLPSNRTSGPPADRDSSFFQLVGVNPVMYLCPSDVLSS